jgi:transketolase
MGDGECNEGSVWEAAQSAAHLKLGNLTAIIYSNELQSDGKVSEVMNTQSLAEKWKSFGWNTIELDGHDCTQLIQSLELSKTSKIPTVIVARTIKGKGISFMENNNSWHHARMTNKSYDEAIQELGA